jgi:gliding motility-associated-like protein
MRLFLLTCLLLLSSAIFSQGFNFSCQKDTTVNGCANSCITLKASIPDLYGASDNYTVVSGTPVSTCYSAYTAPNSAGTSANLTIDDRYSSLITIPFSFPYFGTTYNQLAVSTNGVITFDATLGTGTAFSHYSILNNGTGGLTPFPGAGITPENLPSALYDKALIMGAYQDLDPAYTTSPTQLIQYKVVGTAPYRKFVFDFYKVPQFDCSTQIENTQQIILNESTGIIEVLIYSRQPCTIWNEGRAMIGIQDFSRTKAVMVNGRRASDPAWTVTSNNNNTKPMESYSFIPIVGTGPGAGTSLFKRVELYDLSGTLISTGTSTSNTDGTRSVSFPNVCSPIGTTRFVVRSVYQKNDNPAVEVFGTDTVRIIKNGAIVAANAAVQPSLCGTPSGTITANVTTGVAPYTYSLDGGTFQSTNIFTGISQGNHVITVKDANGCTANVNASVALSNNLTLSTNVDTTICLGGRFTARAISNATSFNWTPSFGLSATGVQNPVITVDQTRTYSVTASLGSCTITKSFTVTTFPGVSVSAGADQTIIAGDQVQLQATATQGTYLWTPSAGLSATNVLNPVAAPQSTTTYVLTTTTPQGCTGSDDVTVTVLPYCVKPMEMFSPNGDGINDLWLVTTGNCLKSAKAEVFNRYGARVYVSENYKNDWNGMYEGKPLADGTYYFVLTYQLINGKLVHLKGNVTILR